MKKQIAGGIAFSFISQVISIVVGLTYTPLMIRILGQSEYGLYQLVQSIINYLNLMNFGFNGAYIRYYSLAKAKGSEEEVANINGMFMKVFLFISFLCVIVGLCLLSKITVLGTQITESEYATARILMVILIINLAISFPNSLYVAYMSANQNFVFQKIINIFTNIFVPILTMPLLYLGYGSVGVVAVTLLLTIVRLFINVYYCYKYLNFSINLKYFETRVFFSLFGYTFFIFLSDLVDQLNTNVDKLLLGSLLGTASVAIYSVAYNLNSYRIILSWIIPEMYVPEINRLVIEEKNHEKILHSFTRTGRLNNYLMMLVITGFILVGKPFINLWVGNNYEISYYSTIILMISGYISAVQTLGVNIQNAMNLHKIRSIIYFFVACANVLFSVFLINNYGVIGTCLGTLFATIIGNGIVMNFYYHYKIKLNVIYFWKELLKWIIPSSILFVAFNMFYKSISINSWSSLFFYAVIYTLCYGLLLWTIGLSSEEKTKVIHSLKVIGHKK